MERMSGLDASFLYLETPSHHMHVCAALVYDPSTVVGGYSFEKVRERIRSRLHLVPPFRRKLAPVPFGLNHPVWVEDPHFDLDYHVRRIGCPSPGTERELAEVTADIAGRPLDRSRPLWEIWTVEGLANGHIGSIAKVHHSTTDGVSGANILVHLVDMEPNPLEPSEPPPEWNPERRPSEVELLGYGLWSRMRRPLKLAGTVVRTAQSAGSMVASRVRRNSGGMAAPFTAPRTVFNDVITPHRKVAFATTSLDEIRAVKRACGTTVNDAVLAVMSGALRRYLQRRGELPDRTLTAVVPVSVRAEEQREEVGTNRVSAMFTSLASDIDDPVERLLAIHDANKDARDEHRAIGADLLRDWTEFAGPTTFSLAMRLYSSMKLARRHPVVQNLVISNVPGPPMPLYFAGARLVALYPLGPIFDGMGLNVTVLSYQDGVDWGLITCRELMPDLWDLARDIPEAQAELVKAAVAVTA